MRLVFVSLLAACAAPVQDAPVAAERLPIAAPRKELTPGLPVVGVLMYDKVLGTEVSASFDVFAKHTEAGAPVFNVIGIAATAEPVVSEEGLWMLPDRTFADAPDLDVLIVPSAYDMSTVVTDEAVLAFIRKQDALTDYTMSHCAGAQLIGASGVGDGKRIVTWIGGGAELQAKYPALKVQDDATLSFVEDGKLFSSNGNLSTYIGSLELLERMTSAEHRAFVASYLYLERLQGWRPTPPG